MRLQPYHFWLLLIFIASFVSFSGCAPQARDASLRNNDGAFGLPLRENDPNSHTGYFFNSEAQSIESRLGYRRGAP